MLLTGGYAESTAGVFLLNVIPCRRKAPSDCFYAFFAKLIVHYNGELPQRNVSRVYDA
jgi:hypothetical protein